MKMIILFITLLLSSSFTLAAPVTYSIAPCTVSFTPGATADVVSMLDKSQFSIHLMAYSFTSDAIGDALVRAKQRGVDVQLVLDRSNISSAGVLDALASRMSAAGINIWIDKAHAIMHNKFIVVDGAIYETGSFNYTVSAELRNAENALICERADLAAVYQAELFRHQSHSIKVVP